MADRVVVGFDGSPAAGVAVRWAAAEARLRAISLVAWTAAGDDQVDLVREDLDELTAGYPVTVVTSLGAAAELLPHYCSDADLLVVGNRGRGGFPGLLLGSVSRSCLSHAPCPVVVVRADTKLGTGHGRVLAGVDASAGGRAALLMAAAEATRRDVPLHAVHAVHWDDLGAEMVRPSRQELVAWGRRLVASEISATGAAAHPVIVPGRAADVLVEHSRRGDLLVIGSRGRGAVAGALLGSVSADCVKRAACPVLVVRCRARRVQDPVVTTTSKRT